MIASVLSILQRGIYGLLRDRRELLNVPIFSYGAEGISGLVKMSLREHFGICVIVLPPIPITFRPNCPIPSEALVEINIRVVEDLYHNKTGHDALSVAEFVHWLLLGAAIKNSTAPCSLLPKVDKPWQLKEDFPDDANLEILLRFTTELTIPWNNGEIRR
jgi:hypothetical protein